MGTSRISRGEGTGEESSGDASREPMLLVHVRREGNASTKSFVRAEGKGGGEGAGGQAITGRKENRMRRALTGGRRVRCSGAYSQSSGGRASRGASWGGQRARAWPGRLSTEMMYFPDEMFHVLLGSTSRPVVAGPQRREPAQRQVVGRF